MHSNDNFQKQIIESVKNDLTSGAMELTHNALVSISDYADSLKGKPVAECQTKVFALTESIRHLRPCMAPLQNTMKEWQQRAAKITSVHASSYISQIQTLSQQLRQEAQSRQAKLQEHAITALKEHNTIITISRSSTVAAVLKALPQKPLNFIICESRPGCEGKNLAMELAREDCQVEYIVDAGISNHIQQADAAIVGADCILNDGSVVNKCGTSLLALAARHNNTPFYVVADSGKCATWNIDALIPEEMPGEELSPPKSPWITPRNYYFDVTDAKLVSSYLTEFGEQRCWPWVIESE